jgi:hypothetical protein
MLPATWPVQLDLEEITMMPTPAESNIEGNVGLGRIGKIREVGLMTLRLSSDAGVYASDSVNGADI